MKLIVGLGNPGTEYERSRHNIGWTIAEAFAAKFRIGLTTHEKNAMTGRGRVGGGSVIVAKPLTYMNLSGEAVKLLVNAYLESTDDLIVVYDDVDLPIGRLRIRPSGSAGTHNGMRSIVAELATERFARLRFGVRGAEYDADQRLRDYVLDEFTEEETPLAGAAVERAAEALVLFARGDLRRAMNEFNGDPVEEEPEKSPPGTPPETLPS